MQREGEGAELARGVLIPLQGNFANQEISNYFWLSSNFQRMLCLEVILRYRFLCDEPGKGQFCHVLLLWAVGTCGRSVSEPRDP